MVELNDAAREVIDGPHVAILATSNRDGRPQSSVIFVKRDGDTVVFSTIKGRLKTRNMTRDPRVSLLVLDTKTGRYVEIRGTVDITEDPEKTLLYEMYERYMNGATPAARARRRAADRPRCTGKGVPVAARTRDRVNGEFACDTAADAC